MISRKERFFTALSKGQPDRVPMFDFLFQKPMYERLIGHRPEAFNGVDAVRCALALHHDGVWLPFGGFNGFQPRFLKENIYVDEWGTTFQMSESSWPIDAPVDYPIKSRADLSAYHAPDPALPGRDQQIREAHALGTDLALLGGVSGPFTGAMMMMGLEKIFSTIYTDPDLLSDCMRLQVDYSKEAARLSVKAGCEGIWISEDLGDSHQGFVNLECFRHFLLPPLAELAEYVDGLGVPVLLHSCGCINAYLKDLAQLKIAAIHPLQRTAGMDLRTVKEQYGRRFCLIGNIDSSCTLPYGSVEDVAAEVREAITIAAPGGGYILASDHSLHDGIPIENILSLMNAGLEYGGVY